jgi:PAS domain S-box-containing protein
MKLLKLGIRAIRNMAGKFLCMRFDPELEAQYNDYMTQKDKAFIRVAYVVFALLFALFSVTDYYLVPQWFSLFFAIRFYIVIPTFILTIILTFHPRYSVWKQGLLLSGLIIGGMAVAFMLVLEPLNILYYGGLFLVFTACYFILNLHACFSILGGMTILSAFVSAVAWTGGASLAVLSAVLFLIAENIMGIIGALQLERFKRREFLRFHGLQKDKALLDEHLMKRNKYLETILQTSADGFLVVDVNNAIIQANDAYCCMSGYAKEELLQLPFDKIDVQRSLDKAAERSRELGETRITTFEAMHYRKDGSAFDVELSATYQDIDGGQFVCFCRDITERKHAETLVRIRMSLMECANGHTLEQLLQKTLDELSALVDSPVGFYHFVEHDQKTLSLQAWSSKTLKDFCAIEGRGMHYGIDKAGVWVDCVRERRPVIHNDYASLPHRTGLPPGHSPVIRELVVPIMRDGLVVAILGVGNKPADYTATDVDTVAYLADVAWEIAQHKRAEERLTKTMHEKEALLRELYHRINNTMQVVEGMLALQASEFPANREVQDLVATTRRRIQAIALVHHLLYEEQDLSKIAIKNYIEELSAMILNSHLEKSGGVRIDCAVDDEIMLLDTAIPLGLLLNELISNSLGLAPSDHEERIVSIELRRARAGTLRMLYSDNSSGQASDGDIVSSGNRGLDLIRIIGEEQLHGKVALESHNGLRYTIEFPDALYSARI